MAEMIRFLPVLLAFVLMFMGIPVQLALLGGALFYFGVLNTTLPMTSVIQSLVSQGMSTSLLACHFSSWRGAL